MRIIYTTMPIMLIIMSITLNDATSIIKELKHENKIILESNIILKDSNIKLNKQLEKYIL